MITDKNIFIPFYSIWITPTSIYRRLKACRDNSVCAVSRYIYWISHCDNFALFTFKNKYKYENILRMVPSIPITPEEASGLLDFYFILIHPFLVQYLIESGGVLKKSTVVEFKNLTKTTMRMDLMPVVDFLESKLKEMKNDC